MRRTIMQEFINLTLDEERALYGIKNAKVVDCSFSGVADGESALKECRNLLVENCFFDLRYPLWHLEKGTINNSKMTENCRAALWYDKFIEIYDSTLSGIKALRECRNVLLSGNSINSLEFGWFCHHLKISNCTLISQYPFMKSQKMEITNLEMRAKYSFQYVKNVTIKNSNLDTKDAFWHSENVRVENSVIKGEYLGWYSKNLHLINCKITGTQPLCYAKGLVLENCEMENCDLSFEKSDVNAQICGSIDSIKNPQQGMIKAQSINQIIFDETCKNKDKCKIIFD